MTTTDQLASITHQYNKIVELVDNGLLDPAAVKRVLQNIIEGKFIASTWSPPTWWRTPEQQLAKARKLWPSATLPKPPVDFESQTKTEVLLLHVPDTFESLWDKVEPPAGYEKYMWEDVEPDDLRFSPQKREFTEPVWLGFDPEHGKHISPVLLWENPNIAASEVLSAVIQYPEWCLSWLNGAPMPSLSGYQLKQKESDDWLFVPHLDLWDDPRRLQVRAHWPYARNINWASPSVREC